MPSSPCNQREPSGNKQANQHSLVTARKENAIKMIAVFSRGLISRPVPRGEASPGLGTMRAVGCRGQSSTTHAARPAPEITPGNKGQNCAHALGTVRLCSSARISVLCALIVHCANPPSQLLLCVHGVPRSACCLSSSWCYCWRACAGAEVLL